MGSSRRSSSTVSHHHHHHIPRLAQIQEESKYSKAQNQRLRRILFICIMSCLALTGVYHIILVVLRVTLSVGSITSKTGEAHPTIVTFPPASLRRTRPDDYYIRAHQAYQQHLQQEQEQKQKHQLQLKKEEEQQQQQQQQEHHLSRQERIDKAIQNLKEYQSDKEAREAEFQQEIKEQIEHVLQEEQVQQQQQQHLVDELLKEVV